MSKIRQDDSQTDEQALTIPSLSPLLPISLSRHHRALELSLTLSLISSHLTSYIALVFPIRDFQLPNLALLTD